jgi:hypothetical protein
VPATTRMLAERRRAPTDGARRRDRIEGSGIRRSYPER